MTDLRTAAQQALEALTSRDGDGWTRRFAPDRAIEALQAALAEPVQEPVAWLWWGDNGDGTESKHVHIGRDFSTYWKPIRPPTPLYTAPPQRKPLTEEEIIDLWAGVSDPESPDISMIDFARAIEQAHGITP